MTGSTVLGLPGMLSCTVTPETRFTMVSGSTPISISPIVNISRVALLGTLSGVERFVKVARGGRGNATAVGVPGGVVLSCTSVVSSLAMEPPTSSAEFRSVEGGLRSLERGKVRHWQIGDEVLRSVYRGCRRRLRVDDDVRGLGGGIVGMGGMGIGNDVSSWRPLKFRRLPRPLAGTSRRTSVAVEGGSSAERGNGEGGSGEAGGEVGVWRGLASCLFSAGLPELPKWEAVGDSRGKAISNGSHLCCSSAAIASLASFEMSRTPSRMMF